MIGTLGELYAGIMKYKTTDAEIFENISKPCHSFNNDSDDNDVLNSLDSFADRDFLDTSELEEELVGGAA